MQAEFTSIKVTSNETVRKPFSNLLDIETATHSEKNGKQLNQSALNPIKRAIQAEQWNQVIEFGQGPQVPIPFDFAHEEIEKRAQDHLNLIAVEQGNQNIIIPRIIGNVQLCSR